MFLCSSHIFCDLWSFGKCEFREAVLRLRMLVLFMRMDMYGNQLLLLSSYVLFCFLCWGGKGCHTHIIVSMVRSHTCRNSEHHEHHVWWEIQLCRQMFPIFGVCVCVCNCFVVGRDDYAHRQTSWSLWGIASGPPTC